MSFSQMMDILQEKNKEKIVLCNLGNFYIAVGKDAVLLNKEIGLKLSCFKEEMCKIGFPIDSLEKYTDMIQEKGYSYIVYHFDKEKVSLDVLMKYNGKNQRKTFENRNNCYICSKGINKYKKTDIYMLALAKLYEKEDSKAREENKKKELKNKEKRKIWFKKKKKKIN